MRPAFLTDDVHADGRVCQVNDLDGYRVWRRQLAGARRIVVIGAGLIGLEFACDLRKAGLDVTVVDLAPQPLGRLLPPDAADVMRQKLGDAGVHWQLGQGIAAVRPGPDHVDVELDDGQVLQGDRVLVAIGLAPRLRLAQETGLETARAIAVDAYGQTSAPHIFALGDCAQVQGQWLPFVAPILHAARAMAQTINGTPTPIAYPAMPVVVKTPQWPTVVLPPPQGAVWTTELAPDGVRARALDAEKTLVGFVLMGAAAAERMAWTRQVGTKQP
jgi:rubredoxin-NAD+ reductase